MLNFRVKLYPEFILHRSYDTALQADDLLRKCLSGVIHDYR